MSTIQYTTWPDAVVVGAGFAGAVTARRLADAGRSVLIIDKRLTIGGNAYDFYDECGVLVHKYGPHIFHTNNKTIFEYLQQFSSWIPYKHIVLGHIKEHMVPIPFNFTSLEAFYEAETAQHLESKLKSIFPNRTRVSVFDIMNCDDIDIKKLGSFIFKNVFVNYTSKQWGIPAHQVDASVINRVPVVIGHEDGYFEDEIQMMPEHGFTRIFENLLDHGNIQCSLGLPSESVLKLENEGKMSIFGKAFSGPVIYTGPLDELFGYEFGPLPYRSLNLCFESHEMEWYQPTAVVNYPNEEAFTRITEFKWLTGQVLPNATTILYEYPADYGKGGETDPYYPVENPKSHALYQAYYVRAKNWKNLHLCGRLALYKYLNMDAAIENALSVTDAILKL